MTHDPAKLFVGTRLIKDANEAGSPITDDNGEWKSGKVIIQLHDSKTGDTLGKHEFTVTRLKYAAWREESNSYSTEDFIEEYFKDVDLSAPSKTELQTADTEAKLKTEARERDEENAALKAKIEKLEKEAAEREEVEANLFVDAVEETTKEVEEVKTETKVDTPKKK